MATEQKAEERTKIKVVSLAPSSTETIYQLGMGEALVGRSTACDYPPEVLKLPVFGEFATPNLEALVRAKPDMLIVNDFKTPTVAKSLENAGISVVRLRCKSVKDYRGGVETLGDVLGCHHAVQQELRRIDERMAEFEELPALATKVLYVVWDSPLMVAGKGSLADELLQVIKVPNVAADVPQEYFKCSFDWVLKNPPDVIVWLTTSIDLKSHRFWGRLKAVQEGRVIKDIDASLVSRPGPRMFDGMAELRKQIETHGVGRE
jgi:iron complex transport system substrate-binding protein